MKESLKTRLMRWRFNFFPAYRRIDARITYISADLESLMSEFGIAFSVFFFFISILTFDANLSEPVMLNESLFFPGLIIFLVYTVYWCIKLYLSFRVPKKS